MSKNLFKLYLYYLAFFLLQVSNMVFGFDNPVTRVLAALNVIGFILIFRELDSSKRKDAVKSTIKIVLCIFAFVALVRLLIYLEPIILG